MSRKGVLTPKEEDILERLVKAGKLEVVDGLVIKAVDNFLIERLKNKYPALFAEYIIPFIDELFTLIENDEL